MCNNIYYVLTRLLWSSVFRDLFALHCQVSPTGKSFLVKERAFAQLPLEGGGGQTGQLYKTLCQLLNNVLPKIHNCVDFLVGM